MPHSHTMRRAMLVALRMSSDAPVVSWLSTICSAARPPMRCVSTRSQYSREKEWRSSWGRYAVSPSARPRGMMVTLCTLSLPGWSHAMSACPAS